MARQEKSKSGEISGWYATGKLKPEEQAARMEDINAWYENRSTLNYRTVPIEVPGKLLAALGKLALDEQMQFSEFVEGIFDEYLTRRGIRWRQTNSQDFRSELGK